MKDLKSEISGAYMTTKVFLVRLKQQLGKIMLKLWGRKTSSNVQKILWALEELEQPYEHEIVGGIYGGKDKKEYASKTPTKLENVTSDVVMVIKKSLNFNRYLCNHHRNGVLQFHLKESFSLH